MKVGKSINRPVLARHLELDKRRRDYRNHLQTLKEQKCGTDFSHPPVVFRFQTIQKNANIKRKERQRYENLCIDKMNEHYANKVINSKSFHDPNLIEQINNSRSRKIVTANSQFISPQSKAPSFQSARSFQSIDNNLNINNENQCDNDYSNLSARNRINSKRSNLINGYYIPHYELPPDILSMNINSDIINDKSQIEENNSKFQFVYNEIAQNEDIPPLDTEDIDTNVQILIDVHPPEDVPIRVTPRPTKKSSEQAPENT